MATQASPTINYTLQKPFLRDLRFAGALYLNTPGVRRWGNLRMGLKVAFFTLTSVGCYLGLVLANDWMTRIVFMLLLPLALAGFGFNVMHDAAHGALSQRAWINALGSFYLDILGCYSGSWDVKHNKAHHTHTNVSGADADLEAPGWLCRFNRSQVWKPWHRWQHYYMPFFYGFMVPRWQLSLDIKYFRRGRIGQSKIGWPKGRQLWIYLGGKLFYYGLVLGIPLSMNWSWRGVLGFLLVYTVVLWILSFLLTMTFQLAHCVDTVEFVTPSQDLKIEEAWGVHEMKTTQDFAPDNRLLNFYFGGLNLQVEHHLFPYEQHVHYRGLRKIVMKQCREHDVVYHCQPTLWAALGSHFRHLRKLGACEVGDS